MRDIEQLVQLRKQLHAQPELSGQEYKTASTIVRVLSSCGASAIHENVGGTGVLAVFDSGRDGETVLFRSELDALPIQETNTFDYRSGTDGISHKCGHDGHSVVLVGLAKSLAKKPVKRGKVVLLFQPSEENGEGARAVMKDERFKPFRPDYAFAFHNLPGFPLNQIILRAGAFTASVKSIIVKFHGKTTHAAEPEHGINPAYAIAESLSAFEGLSNNQPDDPDFTVITPIHIEMGKIAYGVAAGYGELRLTIRAWTPDRLAQLQDEIIAIMEKAAAKYRLKMTYEWTQEFVANTNDAEAVAVVQEAASQCDYDLYMIAHPFKWGEDFGLFTQQSRGAMFGIGAGEDSPALHNPGYDFPDDIIPVGVNLFHSIAQQILG
jgi:amidohydrolase